MRTLWTWDVKISPAKRFRYACPAAPLGAYASVVSGGPQDPEKGSTLKRDGLSSPPLSGLPERGSCLRKSGTPDLRGGGGGGGGVCARPS